MYMYVLAYTVLCVLPHLSSGQSITWNGQVVNNNSLVTLSAVPNRVNSSVPPRYPLVCQGSTGGQWFGSRNVSGGVELYRGTPPVFPHGVQCCTNTTITLCVGKYSDLTLAQSPSVSLPTANGNNYGLSVAATYGPNITGDVQFQLLTPTNVDPPVFQLTCTSTSSPPTDVLWTTNGSPLLLAHPLVSLAVQSGPTSVSVSWTAPTSGGPVTRYDIYYVANRGPIGVQYNISVIAVDTSLPSLSANVTRTLIPLNITQVTSTSITVMWSQPGGEIGTTYTLSYTYQGPCAGAGGGGNVSVAPSAPPNNLTEVTKTSSSVTISWGEVPCQDQNSVIVEYRVLYGAVTSGVGGTAATSGRTLTVNGLSPYTNYSIEVSAVNSDGAMGPYSSPLFVVTAPGPVTGLQAFNKTFTTITLTWQTSSCPQWGDHHVSANVTGVMVSAISTTSVRVSWLAVQLPPDGILTGYTVYYLSLPNTSKRQSGGYTNQTFPPTSTSGDINNLNPNGVYQFSVVAQSLLFPHDVEGSPTSAAGGAAIGGAVGCVVGGVVLVLIAATVVVVIVILLRRKGHDTTSSVTNTSPYEKVKKTTSHTTEMDTIDTGKIEEAQYATISGVPARQAPSIKEFPSDSDVVDGEEVVFNMTTDHSFTLGEDGSLVIHTAEMGHAGVYELEVANELGVDRRRVSLGVYGSEIELPGDYQMTVPAVPLAKFGPYVAKSHEINNTGFNNQYRSLESTTKRPSTVALSSENKSLNRFANIVPYNENLIQLSPMEGQQDCQRSYINASYIAGYSEPKKFIATQGPLPSTVVDLWRSVWQEGVSTIVMVTNIKEDGKVKCQQITEQKDFADYVIRVFEVTLSGSAARKVTQFHFTGWPDHGVPEYATSLLAFHRKVKCQHDGSKGPILVHCSAGVGRTGTLIAIDTVLEQIEKEGLVDIAGTIRKMRRQRMKMVQTPVLEQVSPDPKSVRRDVALEEAGKNRNYINATFVNGYKQQKAFIIAQGPLKSTCRDFWKMVCDRKYGAIVMLSQLEEGGKEVCHQYWPDQGIESYGEFTIESGEQEARDGYTIRTLYLAAAKGSTQIQQVTQFHITNWSPDGVCTNLATITDVIEEVDKVQRRTGNQPIVVHCSDTVGRSGMFCAITMVTQQCKTEGVVDVFQTVKSIRSQKPGAVLTVDQYQLIFKTMVVLLDQFDQYSNFR
eukprot:Em0011g1091a